MNELYYGDCLPILKSLKMGSVDLVYLDPPFNSNKDYNAIYKDETGRPLPDQIEAFCDLWELDDEKRRTISKMPELMRDAGLDHETAEFWRLWMNALAKAQPRLLAYLTYMTERLLPLTSVVKPTGSVLLHCDPTASHYIKAMMDSIFGHKNFRNEIIWHYRRWTTKANHLQKMHDIVLWYSIGPNYTFNKPYQPYSNEKHIKNTVRGIVNGKLVRLKDKSGNYIERGTARKGVPMHDVWHDINFIAPGSKERLGYATQKPVALLERVVETFSNKGDVVLDPFCGCATTIEAANKLDRNWIGIDIAIHAIKRVAKVRLEDRLGLREGSDFKVLGVPHNVEGARHLWERDTYQFQKWAIEQIDGFVTTRKSADGGIDGRLYFSMPDQKELSNMVLEVKGGSNVGIGMVRSLRGVLARDDALMAGLIVMEPLGDRKLSNFKREMSEAGDLNVNGVLYPRMQLLSVEEIMAGRRFTTPSVARGRVIAQPALPYG